ncbi:hypothetical protein [Candidatus Regiella insecticola]|uniref:hypothetical protein n=1 Tax=Candidatus Regiella insecticola TaxID=138073 RepID=UPI000906F38E|nr:hypothetical protein [Candidatus Regiella insecticola]
MHFELRPGGQGERPMSIDMLRDSASTRSQRRRNLKGEGYTAPRNAELAPHSRLGFSLRHNPTANSSPSQYAHCLAH